MIILRLIDGSVALLSILDGLFCAKSFKFLSSFWRIQSMRITIFSCNRKNCLCQRGIRKCLRTGCTIRQKQDLFRAKSKFFCFQRNKNFTIMLLAEEGMSDLLFVFYPNRNRFLTQLLQ